MISDEKTRLLDLFATESRWCQHSEARDGSGEPVRYDDEAAVAWDLVGALCRLFGWQRACSLFGHVDRHVSGQRRAPNSRNEQIAAMAALLDFNDAADTTYDTVMGALRSLPVWRGRSSAAGTDG